jgi:hypothetical protein
MGEQRHFENFVDHILSDDDSELGKTKAELNYALHCLEREIAICARTQARLEYMESKYGKIDWDAQPASTPDLHGEGG